MQRQSLILIFFVFLIGFLPLEAAAQDTIAIDTTIQVEPRFPNVDLIEQFASNPDFIYDKTASNPDGFAQRFIAFIFNLIDVLIGNPIGYFIFRALLILSVGSLVVVLINQLMGGELINVFKKDSSANSFPITILQEELENTNFEELLNEAINQANYPAATRYIYLLALQQLNEKGLITWGIEKTNHDYLNEVNGKPSYFYFNKLTNYYEYVEYGDFRINEESFKNVNDYYRQFLTQLTANG